MAWPRWKRNTKDPTLVHWRVMWRTGGRGSKAASEPAGTSHVPIDVDPMKRIPARVKMKVREVEDRAIGITLPNKRETTEQFAVDVWLPTRKGLPLKTQWREGYINPRTKKRIGILFRYILPGIGKLPIRSVRTEHVLPILQDIATTINPRTGKPMDSTTQRTHAVGHVLFEDATVMGHYPYRNPFDGLSKRFNDYEPGTADWWVPSLDGFCRLIGEVPEEWRALPFVSLLTSMGWGEVTALEWVRDIHFDRHQTFHHDQLGKIHVQRQVPSGLREPGALKERTRKRWIDMLWPVRDVLKDLPMRKTNPPGLVFAGVRGGYLTYSWFYKKVWVPATKRAELPGFHFHWLRHGYASLMAAWGILGESTLYVAQQMGHYNANTTLKFYAHLLEEGIRLDQEATLRALYAAYLGRATPVLPQEPAAEPVDA